MRPGPRVCVRWGGSSLTVPLTPDACTSRRMFTLAGREPCMFYIRSRWLAKSKSPSLRYGLGSMGRTLSCLSNLNFPRCRPWVQSDQRLPRPKEQGHLPRGALWEHSGSSASFVSRADTVGSALDFVVSGSALLPWALSPFLPRSFFLLCAYSISALLIGTVELKQGLRSKGVAPQTGASSALQQVVAGDTSGK